MVLFFKIEFSVSFEESSLQRCKFEIQVETLTPFGCRPTTQICIYAVAYILLCKLNYGYHNQVHFH